MAEVKMPLEELRELERQRADALKQDKDMRTTEQKLTEEIEHLKETIYELRTRSFWGRVRDLFN